jgi:hypothetical protein
VIVVLILAVGVLVLLVWAGRRPSRATQAVRLGSGLLSTLVAVGAVVSGLRGAWMLSLGLVALSAYLAQRAGARAASVGTADSRLGMSRREACDILGVDETADRAAIQDAYRRLIRMGHPDHGGSAAIAAQLNAARDRLLKA